MFIRLGFYEAILIALWAQNITRIENNRLKDGFVHIGWKQNLYWSLIV